MKNFLPIIAVLALTLTGCASSPPSPAPQTSTAEQNPPDAESLEQEEPEGSLEDLDEIEVDQGIYDVTVTIPKLLEEVETTQAEVDATVEEEGWVSGRLNEDGSTTYVIPSNLYEEYLDEMRVSIQEASDELIADEPNIYKEVTFNDTVTKFDVVVDRAGYENAFFTLATFSLGLQGSFFQLFAGVQEDNMRVTVNYIDEQTSEVFQTDTWPDDLD